MDLNTKKLSKKDKLYEIESWDDEKLDLHSLLLRGIYAYGFEKPSTIQRRALYPMISAPPRDICAQAQSGTGKTGAFVTGVLEILKRNNYSTGKSDNTKTFALVLAPTHELAAQTQKVFDAIGSFMKVKTQLLVGGTSVEQDKKNLLENTPHIIVGTPGRVHDMFRRKYITSKYFKILIIDEADEMLSSGFKDQMYKIFQYMPNDIQIGLFSATMPDDLQELTDKFMRNPIKILVMRD